MRLDERPVIFFDSGVGGLPYFAAARDALPFERFVYAADRAGFPYGTKTAALVIERSLITLSALCSIRSPKAVVVACNTATELAIDDIRANFPDIPVVGTVPAIKPAAAASHTKRIAVIASPAAAEAAYLSDLARTHASGCTVYKIGAAGLVSFVENDFIFSSKADRLSAVRNVIHAMPDARIDVIVLGCTHFTHLAPEFEDAVGSAVRIVDSRSGIAARLFSLLKAEGKLSAKKTGADEMFLTGRDPFSETHAAFAERFGLAQAGTLP